MVDLINVRSKEMAESGDDFYQYRGLKNINAKFGEYVFRLEDAYGDNYYIKSELDSTLFRHLDSMFADHNVHEILINTERKMVFDVDYKYNGINPWTMIETIIERCRSVILEYYEVNVDVDRFLIFQSNGDVDGEFKYSYHIVLDRYYFLSKEETEFIWERVCESCVEYSRYLDNIYKSNQSLRIMYSSKIDSTRVKRFVDKYVLGDSYISQKLNTDVFGEVFERSLVSNISNCLLLINRKVDIRSLSVKYRDVGDKCLGEDMSIYSRLMEMLSEHMDIGSFKKGSILQYNDVTLVTLKTRAPYYCFVCEDTHHGENPFFTVVDKGDRYSCNFKCRRKMDRDNDKTFKVYIGRIKKSDLESSDDDLSNDDIYDLSGDTDVTAESKRIVEPVIKRTTNKDQTSSTTNLRDKTSLTIKTRSTSTANSIERPSYPTLGEARSSASVRQLKMRHRDDDYDTPSSQQIGRRSKKSRR